MIRLCYLLSPWRTCFLGMSCSTFYLVKTGWQVKLSHPMAIYITNIRNIPSPFFLHCSQPVLPTVKHLVSHWRLQPNKIVHIVFGKQWRHLLWKAARGMQLLGLWQLDFSMFDDSGMWHFQQSSLTIKFQRVTIGKNYFGTHGNSLANNTKSSNAFLE